MQSVILQPKSNFNWWSKGKLEQRTHKPVPSCIVMEINHEVNLPNGYYVLFKEKENDLYFTVPSFVKID